MSKGAMFVSRNMGVFTPKFEQLKENLDYNDQLVKEMIEEAEGLRIVSKSEKANHSLPNVYRSRNIGAMKNLVLIFSTWRRCY